jgi:fructokinase
MILSAGEALFDMIRQPASSVIEPIIGGSTLNVALGLARLGRDTTYLTKLSTDYFGQQLYDFLVREGIATTFVPRVEGMQSTLGFAFIQPGGHADYAFYVSNAADRSLETSDLPAAWPDAMTAAHFGSYSLAIEPTATTLTNLFLTLAETRFISYDPNIRASLITDRAVWFQRFEQLLPKADFVKASIEDAHWIYGADVTADEIARRWSTMGPRVAVITDGGTGATIAVGGEARFVAAHKVAVVDTVGAGDTFQAAYLTRLDELGLATKSTRDRVTLDLAEEIGRFAVAAAAITCTRRGADLPRRAEVDAFLKGSA